MEITISREYPELVWLELVQGERLQFFKQKPRLLRFRHRGARVELCLSSDALDEIEDPEAKYLLHIPSLDERFGGTFCPITREEALKLTKRE